MLADLQNKNVNCLLNMRKFGIWPLDSTIWQPCTTLSLKNQFENSIFAPFINSSLETL
jgi:hypothetical protein